MRMSSFRSSARIRHTFQRLFYENVAKINKMEKLKLDVSVKLDNATDLFRKRVLLVTTCYDTNIRGLTLIHNYTFHPMERFNILGIQYTQKYGEIGARFGLAGKPVTAFVGALRLGAISLTGALKFDTLKLKPGGWNVGFYHETQNLTTSMNFKADRFYVSCCYYMDLEGKISIVSELVNKLKNSPDNTLSGGVEWALSPWTTLEINVNNPRSAYAVLQHKMSYRCLLKILVFGIEATNISFFRAILVEE